MKFSKSTEYAFSILSYMATDTSKLYTADDIFKNLNIPYRYLRKQLTILTKSGLIDSTQGKFGGFSISTNPETISLLDIVLAVDDKQISGQCFFGNNECNMREKCIFHDKWENVRLEIRKVLSTTTIAELKDNGPHGHLNNNFLLTKIN